MATKKKVTGNNDVQDLDLSITAKKRFRLDGDNDRVIELNTSDMGIITRYEETENKLNKLSENAKTLNENMENSEFAEKFTDVNNQAKELLNYLFDSDIADKCANGGSMFDIFNGQFRFEIIIDNLIALYEKNVQEETKKLNSRLSKYSSKYHN